MSSDTTTLWELCEHGRCQVHPLEKMPGSAGPTMSCPGGRERTAKRVAGEALLVDEYYWVLVEVTDE